MSRLEQLIGSLFYIFLNRITKTIVSSYIYGICRLSEFKYETSKLMALVEESPTVMASKEEFKT